MEKYIQPEMEIIEIDNVVITASCGLIPGAEGNEGVSDGDGF